MKNEENFRPKITYLAKEATVCPVCEHKFFRESLLTGRGRLHADNVTETLHRLYIPSEKFGKIYPLIYSVIVCPDCFFASLPGDFLKVPEDKIEKLVSLKKHRINLANKLVGHPVDFTKFRKLETGAVGYVLASHCYDFFDKKAVPVIKQAICSIRAAFLFEDLENETPDNYFHYISELFYKKTLFLYKRAIELNQKKVQIMETLKTYGPDIDKNYGYDGIIYLVGILSYKFGKKDNPEIRKKELEEGRKYLSKLFGIGKTDKEKPQEILEKSKDFFELISKELKELNG